MKGWGSLLKPGFRCPENITPFAGDARLIPVAGDASSLSSVAQRVHAWMLATYAETGQPITRDQIYRTLGREKQLHGDSPWVRYLEGWPCEELYDASLLYEAPATAEGAE